MPLVYIMPSADEQNRFVGGGSEKQFSNELMDAMEPYLRASGVGFIRASEGEQVEAAVEQANSEEIDLFIAMRSASSPPGMFGHQRGCTVYYYLTSEEGKRAAEAVVRNFKNIYPVPSKVRAAPSITTAELKSTKAPAILIEYGFHDNQTDAQWMKENSSLIPKNLMQSLTRYFKIPFIHPQPVRYGVVATQLLPLNIRVRPNNQTKILARVPKGEKISIFGRSGDWYVVGYQSTVGYANAHYIRV